MLARLRESLSKAAADPTQWAVCVDEMSTALGGAGVLLTLRPPQPGDTTCIAAAGIATEFVRRYAEIYHARDPWVERMATRSPGIWFGYELVPRWGLLWSTFYQEWMAPQKLLPELNILILKSGARPLSTLAAFRRMGTAPLQLEDLSVFRELLPDLQRAVRSARGTGKSGET